VSETQGVSPDSLLCPPTVTLAICVPRISWHPHEWLTRRSTKNPKRSNASPRAVRGRCVPFACGGVPNSTHIGSDSKALDSGCIARGESRLAADVPVSVTRDN
jgi:hypothetical protein